MVPWAEVRVPSPMAYTAPGYTLSLTTSSSRALMRSPSYVMVSLFAGGIPPVSVVTFG